MHGKHNKHWITLLLGELLCRCRFRLELFISSGRTTWVHASSDWPRRTRSTRHTSSRDTPFPATTRIRWIQLAKIKQLLSKLLLFYLTMETSP